MSTLRNRLESYALATHPVGDSLIIVISLFIALSVDLTHFPEAPAIIVYQLLLLCAAAAVIHIVYIRRVQKKHK